MERSKSNPPLAKFSTEVLATSSETPVASVITNDAVTNFQRPRLASMHPVVGVFLTISKVSGAISLDANFIVLGWFVLVWEISGLS